MSEERERRDLQPTDVNVYGYTVTYRKAGTWIVDEDDEYSNIPAHFPFLQQALDRARFMRAKGVECRVSALLAEATDTAEDFEASKLPVED